jgi:hypothetical protein
MTTVLTFLSINHALETHALCICLLYMSTDIIILIRYTYYFIVITRS